MTTDDYSRQVRRVFSVTLGLNLTVALAKIVLGAASGVLSITADGVHSLTDASGNMAGLIGLRLAAKPPDHDHPYGHARYETIAALVIGLLLLLSAWEIVTGLLDRLSHDAPEITPLVWAVLLVTLTINVFVSRYQSYHGRRLNSPALIADARHTQSDVWVTLAVIASTIAIALTGWGWIDLVMTLIVAALIVRAAWDIIQQTTRVLADTAPYSADEIIPLIDHLPQIEAVERVRARGTPDAAHIDVDVRVSPEMTVGETADVTRAIREQLRASLEGVEEVEVHYAADAPAKESM
jgi:cation diffusion facilitator family transporter